MLQLRDCRLPSLPSPLGNLRLVCEDDTLVALDYEGYDARLRELLRLRFGEVGLIEGDAPKSVVSALSAYFSGDIAAINALPVRMGGSEFQQLVWKGLREIEPGSLMSYGQLAKKLGLVAWDSARAVGHANSQNPIAIVVPCHRVIGANHKLTGYAGGLERKQWLLKHEGALLM